MEAGACECVDSRLSGDMRIRLTKHSDDRHTLEIVRTDGTRESAELVSREFLFHDLLHYAVESTIGARDGFWGALANGKTMGDLNDRSGKAMADLSGSIAGIEAIVGMMTGVVKGGAPADQAIASIRSYCELLGQAIPGWCTASFVIGVRERMRRILGRWKAIPYRQTMEIEWPDGSYRVASPAPAPAP